MGGVPIEGGAGLGKLPVMPPSPTGGPLRLVRGPERTYVGYRTPAGTVVYVAHQIGRSRLARPGNADALTPDWGRLGDSLPLARAILADALGTAHPHPALVTAFAAQVLAVQPRRDLRIELSDIADWLAARVGA